MMLKFYDFLFYLIYKFYSPKETGAPSSAAGIVGGLQAINVLAIFMFFLVFLQPKINVNKISFIVVFILFQVTTYFRYLRSDNNSVKRIEERWLQKDEFEKKKIRGLSVIYILLSILVFFGLAIFLGTRK